MQTKDRWVNSKTAVYNLAYHIIWCPKYRRKVLVNDVEKELKRLLYEKAYELNCTIETLEVMPDHVHIFIKTPPTIGVHFLVQQLKGVTARKLRKKFHSLKTRLPNMWTRSYYAESVGHISEDTIKHYIEEQKNK
jgi:putative transposase